MKTTKKAFVSLQNLSILVHFYLILRLQNLNISAAYIYSPHENIALDCGSTVNNTDLSARLWLGDTKNLDLQANTASILSNLSDTESIDIPYKAARLSRSQFSYTFNVTRGEKFVRLHFYPTSYREFNRSNAFFDVHIGRYTLLSNFNASLTADYLKLKTFSKEFCINVEDDQELNISFTASPSMTDSYALVNGIEVVSMPDSLYYSAENYTGFQFVDYLNPYRIGKDMALEMVYRINVGGSSISPARDTGMYRSWSEGDEYMTDGRTFAFPVITTMELSFNMIHNYTAPAPIYQTAMAIGINKTMNEDYGYEDRLTWQFPVDSGFTYFVRLHFCALQEIQAAGHKVFHIYINNIMSEYQADVISWAKGIGIPVYRDYAVTIDHIAGESVEQKIRNLSISFYPTLAWMITNHSDAILNGLEIFKLSNDGNLAASTFYPVEVLNPPDWQHGKKRTTIVSVVIPISSFVATSLLFFLIYRIVSNKTANNNSPTLLCDVCRHFSLREIKAATDNFDQNLIIGRGGFGNVYKGFINAGSTMVAIKRLNPGSLQGVLEFRTEIDLLSQLRHQNLVSLIGYCEDKQEMILVYDYMVHGTLRDHLYNTNSPPLPWNQRVKMCIGAAHGLNYLHRGPIHTIIHRDVKTTNILLSEKWVAKVSDLDCLK